MVFSNDEWFAPVMADGDRRYFIIEGNNKYAGNSGPLQVVGESVAGLITRHFSRVL
jgi:hypothetical protein